MSIGTSRAAYKYNFQLCSKPVLIDCAFCLHSKAVKNAHLAKSLGSDWALSRKSLAQIDWEQLYLSHKWSLLQFSYQHEECMPCFPIRKETIHLTSTLITFSHYAEHLSVYLNTINMPSIMSTWHLILKNECFLPFALYPFTPNLGSNIHANDL